MSGAEFEAEVRNSMRALQTAIEGVGRAQKKTTDEVARFGGVATQAFKKPVSDADKLEAAAKKSSKAWREAGQAIGKLGGPLGEIAARFGGGFGMEGGLSRIAVAAALAGLAMKALTAVVQKQVKDAQDAADAWRKMSDAIEAAGDKSDAAATGALGQAGGRRKVRAIGGEEGIQQLDALTVGGVVSEDEGTAGLASIYGRFGRSPRARAAVETARALAQTGVPFDQAAAALAKGGGDLTQPGAARQTAGRVFNEFYGSLGGGASGFNQALSDTGGDMFLKRAADAHGFQAQTAAVGRAGVVAGKAGATARADLAAAKNPATDAVLKVYNQHLKAMDLLYKLAELQGTIATNFKNMGVIFGGEGSADFQTYGADRNFEAGTKGISYGDGG